MPKLFHVHSVDSIQTEQSIGEKVLPYKIINRFAFFDFKGNVFKCPKFPKILLGILPG